MELRSRNPRQQRTLTYMDKKRDEFRTNRLEEENRMRRDFQEKAKEIAEGVEKQDAQSEGARPCPCGAATVCAR